MSFINEVKNEILNKTKKSLNKKDSLSFLYGFFKTTSEINVNSSEIQFILTNSDYFNIINLALKTLLLDEAEIEIDEEITLKNNSYDFCIAFT